MHTLYIQFRACIDNSDIDQFMRHSGPVFHRWLPNGEQDALVLDQPENNLSIGIWFERRGYVDDSGFIKHDHKRKEVDDSVVPRQAILEAGAIFGKVTLTAVPESQYEAVINNEIGSKGYESLGKFVVKKVIDPFLQRASKILRDTYGQYWVAPPSSFDSRDCSLGQYCHHRAMEWSTPDGKEGEFVPTEKSTEPCVLTVGPSDYSQYLSQDCWKSFGYILASEYMPPLSTTILSRARRLADEGRIEHALIEIITALEISLEEYVRSKLNNDTKLMELSQGFWQLPLPARITLLASLMDVSAEDVEKSLEVVSARNSFVHDGKHPVTGIEEKFSGVLSIIRSLAGDPVLKFPSANHGNALKASAEDWES